MTRLLSPLLAAALLLAGPLPQAMAAPAPAAAPKVDSQYTLRYGDTVNLKVVENEKLTLQDQPIRPDGRVSFPLIGEVQAGGLTLPQLTDRVTQAYGRFFVDPHVVINVEKFRPLTINVVGFVNRPGTYEIKEPVRLLQAIALGGGYDLQRAELKDVLVLRANGEVRHADLTGALSGRSDDNLWLQDGDTVRIAEVAGPDWFRLLPPLASALSIGSTIVLLIVQTQAQR
ncbi:MAG: polysaccharide biosynthesis/export family protein [Candidatus Sericytochromatia bacterium]|nr:polysaccharide biosynthesis/export family protein [Candidatus Sericytochromatia bacterium]